MVRLQIQLSEDQARGAKQLARERGVSMAQVIRTALEQELARSADSEVRARSLGVIGCVSSGLGDVSINHDDYLAEAFLSPWPGDSEGE